jgi:uncharacterized protein YbjT (DUF2867 family)
MLVLVTGGTGTVGREVVTGLIAAEIEPRVLTRSKEKIATLRPGAVGFVGDFSDPEALPDAMDGVERLFLLNALSPTETQESLAAFEAAKEAGVKHIVYMSVHKLREASHIPHFGSKVPVEDAIAESGLSYTFLQPNSFFQNDVWLREAITNGVYPFPLSDVGLSRVDVRDIADAAVRALLTDDFAGGAYPIVGSEALTSQQVVATYAKHLGRDVAYLGGDLDTWEEQAGSMMPQWMVDDLRIMNEYFREHGLVANAEEVDKCREILGCEPRSFDAFAAEMVRGWMKSEERRANSQ